jgi:hypothetical protein
MMKGFILPPTRSHESIIGYISRYRRIASNLVIASRAVIPISVHGTERPLAAARPRRLTAHSKSSLHRGNDSKIYVRGSETRSSAQTDSTIEKCLMTLAQSFWSGSGVLTLKQYLDINRHQAFFDAWNFGGSGIWHTA